MIRRAVRDTMEAAGSLTGLASLARRHNRDSIAVLAWHNVVPASAAARGDASLHLSLDQFIRQIERLERTHEIIDIEDATAPYSGGRPRAVITFDDAYHGAVTLALPELIRRGLPAVVFVSPALLGSPSTWWDEMAEAGVLTDSIREHALTGLAGRADPIREHFVVNRSAHHLSDTHRIATRDELYEHCAERIRIGSHAWHHEYLPALDANELTENLSRTMTWLDAWQGPVSRWLALPYGGGSPNVSRIAMEAGHCGVLRIEGGLWRPGSDVAHVPRINVPAGLSLRGMDLRTSGLRA